MNNRNVSLYFGCNLWCQMSYCHHYEFVNSCPSLPSLSTFHIYIISFESTRPIGTKICRNYVLWGRLQWIFISSWSSKWLATMGNFCKMLYKYFSWRLDWTKNMAAMGNSCFWLTETLKVFSSATTSPNNFVSWYK